MIFESVARTRAKIIQSVYSSEIARDWLGEANIHS